MSDHSLLSPSTAPRWVLCPGSVWASKGIPPSTSEYAEEGTKAHDLAAQWLKTGKKPAFDDPEMEAAVGVYVKNVNVLTKGAVARWVEQKLNLENVLQVKGELGTGDTVALMPKNEVQVHDLKYGKGVLVAVEGNYQLIEYGLGGMELAEIIADETIEKIRLFIHQPRLSDTPDEFVYTREQMLAFQETLRQQAAKAMAMYNEEIAPEYEPGEKQCRFCPAKGVCTALQSHCTALVMADFDVVKTDAEAVKASVTHSIAQIASQPVEVIAALLPNLDLISDWIKAVRVVAESKMFAGEKIPGWKLVEGKRGDRKWTSEEAAEKVFKSMRLKIEEMYTMKLITPTQAEKLLKSTPRRWTRLEELISRSAGKPTIAPQSDKRPEYTPPAIADEFEDLTAKPEAVKLEDLI